MFALPDRLWRVDDLDGVIRDSYSPGSPWLWSTTLTVREELPNWRVMGPHGDTVMQVIGQVRALTDEQAQAIGTMDAAEETRIVGACADRLRQATRAFGFPIIGCGWIEAHNAASKAAQRASTRPFARTDPDDPGTEDLADPAWVQARAAGRAAVLAFGAPEFFDQHERETLARRWTSVVGPPAM